MVVIWYSYWVHLAVLNLLISSTSAFAILTSTLIAKLCSTPARHVKAPLTFFNPEFAVVTLLEVLPFHKCVELRIVLIYLRFHLVLLASHPGVEDCSARQAIVFVAHRAI